MCKICLNLSIRHQNDAIDVVLVLLVLTLNRLHTFYGVLADFEEVNENIKINRILPTEKLQYFSIFMNFANIYFQLYHFNLWPQINAPLYNSFRKIFQFADITHA